MKNIDKLYKQWQELQPLKVEDKKRLDQKFMLEFNYNSNHIEGSTLTYGQTKLLLMFDETSGSAPLKDYEEMKAHNVGFEMVKAYAMDNDRPLSESFIRELNKVILVQNYWKDATTSDGQPTRMEVKVGEYKSRPNSVVTATGEVFAYATPEQTPALMSDLVGWFNDEVAKKELAAVELAALLHYRYIRIHPFEDGNGRIARLLVNYVMVKYGYPMVVIKTDDKPNYLRTLHQCDVECGFDPFDGANATLEQITPFVEYLEHQLEYGLDICIRAAKGESIEEMGDWKKKLDLKTRSLAQAPLFSDEVAYEVTEKSIYFLAKKIDSAFKEYESLFTKTPRFIRNIEQGGSGTIENLEIIPTFDYSANWKLGFYYVKKTQGETVNFIFEITCDYHERDYAISLVVGDKEETHSLTKRYNEFITDEDTNEMLDFVGARFYEFISSNIIIDE